MRLTVYFVFPVMAFLLIIQTSLLPRFPLWGVVPQLLLIAAVAWGLLEGVREGAFWAFTGGLFSDLFSLTPLGISSLTFMGAVIAVSFLHRNLPLNRLIWPSILSGVAALVWLILYFFLLRLVGFGNQWQQMANVPQLLLVHAGLIVPFYWFFFGLLRALRPRTVEV